MAKNNNIKSTTGDLLLRILALLIFGGLVWGGSIELRTPNISYIMGLLLLGRASLSKEDLSRLWFSLLDIIVKRNKKD